jgi:ubiquinone/menaquinone biosynthesis C-methylase UbiE
MKMGRIEKLFVNGGGHSRRVAARAVTLARIAEPTAGERYLDVGCGNGAAAIHVARELGLDATGVDVDPAQVEAAGRAAAGCDNIRFLVADATRLPFADGEFDLVATSKLTHHVPGWEQAFAELIRVLAPGGRLVYGDLVFPAPLARLGETVAPGRGGYPTRERVRRLVGASRLTTVRLRQSPAHIEGVFRKPAEPAVVRS